MVRARQPSRLGSAPCEVADAETDELVEEPRGAEPVRRLEDRVGDRALERRDEEGGATERDLVVDVRRPMDVTDEREQRRDEPRQRLADEPDARGLLHGLAEGLRQREVLGLDPHEGAEAEAKRALDVVHRPPLASAAQRVLHRGDHEPEVAHLQRRHEGALVREYWYSEPTETPARSATRVVVRRE